MRRFVKKTIINSKINYKVFENGALTDREPMEYAGKLNITQAQAKVREILSNKDVQVLVTSIEEEAKTYRMPTEQFLAEAELMEEDEQEDEE